MTLCITTLKHNDIQRKTAIKLGTRHSHSFCYAECRYAECRGAFLALQAVEKLTTLAAKSDQNRGEICGTFVRVYEP